MRHQNGIEERIENRIYFSVVFKGKTKEGARCL